MAGATEDLIHSLVIATHSVESDQLVDGQGVLSLLLQCALASIS